MVLNINEYNAEYFNVENRHGRAGRNIFCAQTDKVDPKIKADLEQVKKSIQPAMKLQHDVDRFETAQKILYAGGILPPLRRIGSLPESIKDDNWVRAGLLASLAAANLSGDFREVTRAGKEVADILTKGVLPSAKHYKGQHMMNFFNGTFMENFAEKHTWLKNIDKSLFNTTFGKFLQKNLNINIDSRNIQEVKIPGLKHIIQEHKVEGFYFKGNAAQKLFGKFLLRIPVLGLIASSALEVPALVKSVNDAKGDISDKGKAFGQQLIKSASYIGLATAGIAMGGAILGTTAIGSLAGMAIGSAVGLIASDQLNKKIDQAFKPELKQHA